MLYVATGQLPISSPLKAALLDTDSGVGLVTVRHPGNDAAVATLNTATTFARRADSADDPIMGAATQGIGEGWVDSFKGQGYMVMTDLAAAKRDELLFAISKDPFVIAFLTREPGAMNAPNAGGFAMLDGPPELAVEAMKVSQGQAAHDCPGGQAWAPDLDRCKDYPGGVEPAPTTKSATGLPSWVLPVAAVVAGVSLIAVAAGSKRTR